MTFNTRACIDTYIIFYKNRVTIYHHYLRLFTKRYGTRSVYYRFPLEHRIFQKEKITFFNFATYIVSYEDFSIVQLSARRNRVTQIIQKGIRSVRRMN